MAIKKGQATSLNFGTSDATGLTITTSVSAEMSFATELFVKDNDGETVGMVLADERGTATITGYAQQAPSSSLGEQGTDPSGTISGDVIVVTGVRTNQSNEDFTTYETTITGFSVGSGTSSDKRLKHEISDLSGRVEQDCFTGDLAYLVQELKSA
jgi:hypothetical protein